MSVPEAVGAVGAAVPVVVGAAQGIRLYARARRRRREREERIVETLEHVTQEMQAIRGSLEEVRQELVTNGGTTLRDAVHLIETQVATERVIRRTAAKIASYDLRVAADGEVVEAAATPEYTRLTGLTADDVLAMQWLRAVDASDRERARATALDAADRGIGFVVHYECVNVATGVRAYVEHRGTPVRTRLGGRIVAWVAVLFPLPSPVRR